MTSLLDRELKKVRLERPKLAISPSPRDPGTCKQPYYDLLKCADQNHDAICTSLTLCGGVDGCHQHVPFKDMDNREVHKHKDITHIQKQALDIKNFFATSLPLTYQEAILSGRHITGLHKILRKRNLLSLKPMLT